MKRYKIVVAYDGTDFHGWQIQPSDVTIVSTLQSAFKRAFSKDIVLVGASRTDAGVHALGQVALGCTELDIDPKNIVNAWNNSLPKFIVVRSIEEVDKKFHVFADVLQKTYFYHLFLDRPLPLLSRYGFFWKFIDSVDWKKFKKAMTCFVGEHDFRSFSKNEPGESTIRTIDSVKVKQVEDISPFCDVSSGKIVRVEIKAKGFLRYQIRRMIGAALDVGRKGEVDFIMDLLQNPSDQQEYTRAEACGLCLRDIMYK